jgi:TRAP-type C4-dicarboxylate transport system permease small subunit
MKLAAFCIVVASVAYPLWKLFNIHLSSNLPIPDLEYQNRIATFNRSLPLSLTFIFAGAALFLIDAFLNRSSHLQQRRKKTPESQ